MWSEIELKHTKDCIRYGKANTTRDSLEMQPGTGIDELGSESMENQVAAPRIKFTPCSVLEDTLFRIDPLQSCSDKGVNLYTRAIEISGLHLSSQCSQSFVHVV